MTQEKLLEFATKLDNVCEEFMPHLDGDSNIEGVLLAIADLIDLDKSKQTHELIIACLDSASEGIRRACFDYYASWK